MHHLPAADPGADRDLSPRGENILTGLIALAVVMSALTLVLLRPVKGAVIGLQWAGRDYQR
ncbi:DUF983 domain-containing protein [Falsigemmobacter intermedius]|uniref:DUF983 domain-containing protein n=1 Tax=Falsigemmobacter intermedius TaxID=1553448 RepID=A0A444M8G3_9RHOB|nr:DUF983 domain-containing protein [Falsigemmobacter intermedius]